MLNLSPSNSVLVIIDWQERLSSVMDAGLQARNLKKASILTEAALAAEVPILLTEQYPKGLGPTVAPLRDLLSSATRIEKRDFACSAVPEFSEALKQLGRSHVILAGMEAHICVYQTARGLLAEGYVVHIPRDAVLSRSKTDFQAALSLYERSGAITTSTETVVFDWVGRAEGDLFKAVSRLVR